MDLSERIIKYIENHHPISYTSIVNVAAGKGFSESQVLQALDTVGRNKSIITKTRKDEVWYYLVTVPAPVSNPTHVSWLAKNYPRLKYEMPFPEIDMSFLFMKPEQAKEYKAAAKGLPVHMMSKYGTRWKQTTVRHP